MNSEETKSVVPISRALIGNRSAVVIKTPKGDVEEKRIPAGKININGLKRKESVDVEEGAENIMQSVNLCAPIEDIKGEPGTNAEECLKK